MYRLWEYCFCWDMRFSLKHSWFHAGDVSYHIDYARIKISVVQSFNIMTIISLIQDKYPDSVFYPFMMFMSILIFNILYFSEKRYSQMVKKFKISKLKDALALSYYLLSFVVFLFVF